MRAEFIDGFEGCKEAQGEPINWRPATGDPINGLVAVINRGSEDVGPFSEGRAFRAIVAIAQADLAAKPLPGDQLDVLDDDGNVVETFRVGKKPSANGVFYRFEAA